jgi:sugar lactone lactonase YvrE
MTNTMVASRSLLTALVAFSTLGAACSAPSWPSSPIAVTQLAHFDAKQGAMSEGLAIRGTTAYVGFAPSGQIMAVDLATGKATPYSTLPTPVAGKGFVTGLALRGGDLYGALVSFVPDVQAGIYRTVEGAPATLYAKHPEMLFPNGLVFDETGQLYVTDSAAGAVFRVSPTGEVTKWAAGPLLTGGKDGCGAGNGVGVPFDIGANGIVIDNGAVVVTNTDRGSLVRIQIQSDGSAGPPTAIAGPSCADLNGADGLAVARNGDFIVAVNHQNKLARVDRAGHVTTVLARDPLDFPTSLTFVDGALYVGNFAFLDARNPGLLRVQ